MWLAFDKVHFVIVLFYRSDSNLLQMTSFWWTTLSAASFCCLLHNKILYHTFFDSNSWFDLPVFTKMHEMFIFGFLCRCYKCALRFPLVFVQYTNFNWVFSGEASPIVSHKIYRNPGISVSFLKLVTICIAIDFTTKRLRKKAAAYFISIKKTKYM